MTGALYVSAAHKSSGKTTLAIGLCAALGARGRIVQPYKKGPDYIDPLWLTAACARPCHNLDYHTMGRDEITDLYQRAAHGADLSLIEGNKGLFDGVAVDGSNSNAALARQLATPIVLVLDARGSSRGVAPLVIGYQHFDPGLWIAGVILNRVGGARHEAKLRAVLERYTDVPVWGALEDSPELTITERHLGLVPSGEWEEAQGLIERVGRAVANGVDIDALLALSQPTIRPAPTTIPAARPPDIRIGVARDRAFSFYYPGDLEALERSGARLVFIDTLHDTRLPEVDGLIIGGGFPETQAAALSANVALRAAIKDAIEAGLPVYAECGGLMYLTRRLTWQGHSFPMVGIIAADTVMEARPVGHGYARLRTQASHPWVGAGWEAADLPAHEFHYSRLVDIDPNTVYAYEVARGTGIAGHRDGIVRHNMLASYAHLRDVAACRWTGAFMAFIRRRRVLWGQTVGDNGMSDVGLRGPVMTS